MIFRCICFLCCIYIFMHICIVCMCQVFIHTCDLWWKQPVVWYWSEVQPSQHAAEQSSGWVLSCCVKNLVPEATSLKWMCVKQLLKNQFLCNELEVSNWNKHFFAFIKWMFQVDHLRCWFVSMRGIKGPPPPKKKDGLWTWQENNTKIRSMLWSVWYPDFDTKKQHYLLPRKVKILNFGNDGHVHARWFQSFLWSVFPHFFCDEITIDRLM